jgi:hypothetical protein
VLRHYCSNQRVTSSILDEIISILIDFSLPTATMVLGSTPTLKTNKYQEYFVEGGLKSGPERKADNLTAICESTV